jgi:hypothetical protein
MGSPAMRVFAIHDAEGTIWQLVTSPTDLSPPVLTTAPGLSMTEVEIPEGVDVADDAEGDTGRTELIENYRVEVTPQKATLARLNR